MTVLELQFPAGRYHATPWGRHVNEGAVEWPPSPWRILRALVATWHWKARETKELDEPQVRALIHSLASAQPSFHLPRATLGHTRHYMPVNSLDPNKKPKVFDTFVQIAPDDPILIAWDIDLPEDQLSTLQLLADRLGYFGRAESLAIARVSSSLSQPINAQPLRDDEALADKQELVRLLLPCVPENYASWRSQAQAKAEAALGPRPTAAQRRRLPKLPEDVFAALHADTGDLQAAGWNLPPGAVFANYSRPSDVFAPVARKAVATGKTQPTVARYQIVSTVAPRITQAVSVADRVHKSLCKFMEDHPESAPVFTGKDADTGEPLSGRQHAFIFCEANGKRDEITHLTITAAAGFDENARKALRRLNKVWGYGGHDVRLVLVGLGDAKTFPDCKLFAASKVWRSLTPVVSTRHTKTFRDGRPKLDEQGRPIGGVAHDLERLLQADPQCANVQPHRERHITLPNGRTLRCLQFQSRRPDGNGGSRGNESGAFTIEFEQETQGPLAFGYGSHFGLGLFVPAASPKPDTKTP